MKTEKNILIAFILNATFAVVEVFGGILTGSVAILSDAVHDMGDATSIGISFLLEKKSKRPPNETYTYGYARYSALGALITTLILLFGSALVLSNAVHRLAEPVTVHPDGMILLALLGICVNFCAAFLTHTGYSLNQRAVNLHMLEDTLGWVAVLVGGLLIRFTGYHFIDPILSMALAVFMIIGALKNLKRIFDLFLEKIPQGMSLSEISTCISEVDGVLDVHHVHIWSMDGHEHFATMHLVVRGDAGEIKACVRRMLAERGIAHVTMEFETEGEECDETQCRLCDITPVLHRHHHHHHGHGEN